MFPLPRLTQTFALIGLTLMLCACAAPKHEALPPDQPVEEIYNKATDLMAQKEYVAAAFAFQEVERQHPYSTWATRAQIMTAYAYYQAMEYDKAITTLDEYTSLHPGSDDIAYATYLRALCNYERIADVRRDQTFAKNTLKDLEMLIRRFPDSPYAKDAALKVSLVNDHMAGAEMEIARNYMKHKLYIAAIGRFKTVVEKFQTTSHVPEAMHRLVECYLLIGIPDEAKSVASVLGYNYPGSKWYQRSYDLLVKKKVMPEEKEENDDGWLF